MDKGPSTPLRSGRDDKGGTEAGRRQETGHGAVGTTEGGQRSAGGDKRGEEPVGIGGGDRRRGGRELGSGEIPQEGLTRLLPAVRVSKTTGEEVPGARSEEPNRPIARDEDRGSGAALPGEAG